MSTPSVYAQRREQLMAMMGPQAVAIFPAPPLAVRNRDVHYPYRQSSDLFYLTGFREPESILVLRPGADRADRPDRERMIMFVRPRDPERETWDGLRAGPEGAVTDYGIEAAYPIQTFTEKLPSFLTNIDDLYYSVGLFPDFDAKINATIAENRLAERRLGRPPGRIIDPRYTLHELRLHKTPEEVAQLLHAATITREAHVAAMRAAKPGMHEYELAALVDYTFCKLGAAGPGYSTIVGAGANATILHYIENRARLAANDLVLIDAGAEYDHYTADVTRTFPVKGTFSPAQRRIYACVLEAQEQAILMARPGVTLDDIHHRAIRTLTEGMLDMGLLSGSIDQCIEEGTYRKYYMHRTSHWLGMDVHDVGSYSDATGQPRRLEPKMVITIEPGLYVSRHDTHAPPEYRGIGVRIEDDILITDTGIRNLTESVPKQITDVESLCV